MINFLIIFAIYSFIDTCVVAAHENQLISKNIFSILKEKELEVMLNAKKLVLLVRARIPKLVVSY